LREFFTLNARLGRKTFDAGHLLQTIHSVVASRDPLVRQALEAGIAWPTGYQELADFCYSVSILKDMENGGPGAHSPRMVLVLFDIIEGRTCYTAKRYRNQGFLTHRGLFNAQKPQKTAYDNLSYICLRSVSPLVINAELEYLESEMDSVCSLYHLPEHAVEPDVRQQVMSIYK
jgi:hypothetical protein